MTNTQAFSVGLKAPLALAELTEDADDAQLLKSRDAAHFQCPVQDWDSLDVGDPVEVQIPGEKAFFGFFDDCTLDGQIAWIIEDAGGRRMYLQADGIHLYRDSTQKR